MRRLLVTGGAGFIGINFVRYWLRQHPQDRLVVLDALTYAATVRNFEGFADPHSFHFVHGNILDDSLVDRLFADEQIDTVVHFAAESHVDRSISSPDAFVQTNIVGTHVLLKAARKAWLDAGKPTRDCRFHHVSTDEVYGALGSNDPAFTEEMSYAPNSPYSASKAGSDHLVRAYRETYGLPVTISNCSNNFGPYQYPEKLIPLMLINALSGRELPVYGDGQQVRDWLYVEDHVRGVERILEAGRVGETYNIGSSNEWTNLKLVHVLCDLLDQRFRDDRSLRSRFPECPASRGANCSELISHVTDRPGHDRRYAINATKMRRDLGFECASHFNDALTATVDWYIAHETWWRGLLATQAKTK